MRALPDELTDLNCSLDPSCLCIVLLSQPPSNNSPLLHSCLLSFFYSVSLIHSSSLLLVSIRFPPFLWIFSDSTQDRNTSHLSVLYHQTDKHGLMLVFLQSPLLPYFHGQLSFPVLCIPYKQDHFWETSGWVGGGGFLRRKLNNM